jgi:hypothetical protein
VLHEVEKVLDGELFALLADLFVEGGELLLFEVHAEFEELVGWVGRGKAVSVHTGEPNRGKPKKANISKKIPTPHRQN